MSVVTLNNQKLAEKAVVQVLNALGRGPVDGSSQSWIWFDIDNKSPWINVGSLEYKKSGSDTNEKVLVPVTIEGTEPCRRVGVKIDERKFELYEICVGESRQLRGVELVKDFNTCSIAAFIDFAVREALKATRSETPDWIDVQWSISPEQREFIADAPVGDLKGNFSLPSQDGLEYQTEFDAWVKLEKPTNDPPSSRCVLVRVRVDDISSDYRISVRNAPSVLRVERIAA